MTLCYKEHQFIRYFSTLFTSQRHEDSWQIFGKKHPDIQDSLKVLSTFEKGSKRNHHYPITYRVMTEIQPFPPYATPLLAIFFFHTAHRRPNRY